MLCSISMGISKPQWSLFTLHFTFITLALNTHTHCPRAPVPSRPDLPNPPRDSLHSLTQCCSDSVLTSLLWLWTQVTTDQVYTDKRVFSFLLLSALWQPTLLTAFFLNSSPDLHVLKKNKSFFPSSVVHHPNLSYTSNGFLCFLRALLPPITLFLSYMGSISTGLCLVLFGK